MREKTAKWKEALIALSRAAKSVPQSAYIVLQKSLQAEWQFVQRVVKGIDDEFEDIASEMSNRFLPALLNDKSLDGDIKDHRKELATLPVKYCGLALPDPTKTAKTNLEASELITGHLTGALRGRHNFNPAEHTMTCKSVRARLKKDRAKRYEAAFDEILQPLPPELQRILTRGKKTGQFCTVHPSDLHGTVLSPLEIRDAWHIRWGMEPPDLPESCDGCNADFTVRHALSCKKGGLPILRHNEIRDELADFAEKAFCASAIRSEPKIHLCCDNEEKKANQSENEPAVKKNLCKQNGEERGDLLIRNLWNNGTDCIIDVRCTDTDAKSYKAKDPMEVLALQERERRRESI